ncbi:TlpA disulfide reductase family protein [Corynebacterium pseudotuberculosis]|uniref:TlpA disulfide reductase family protein n=1 Tax=Corynebacterium pseudotuberculosis TaxID=1719 RepID=UPI002FFB4C17
MKRTLAATMISSLLVLSACSSEDTAGTDAVAIGGTFQFHSPGGQTEIFYEEADRAPVKNISGESLSSDAKISLDDYKDQVVVLNAWGQWCAPCRSESDDLQTVQAYLEKEQRGTVLGINVRDYSKQIAQDFVKDNGLTYPSLYDPPFKSAAQLGGVPAAVVPTTIILDKQHRPAAVFLREITAKDVIDVVERIV